MVLAHGSYGIKTMAANVKPLKNGSLVPVLLPQTPGFGHFNPAKQLADRMYALYLNLTLPNPNPNPNPDNPRVTVTNPPKAYSSDAYT